jgi:ribosomal-protein-alanine N-acetyltransferase
VPSDELTVSGPRLTLRYPRPADAPRFFELASDAEVTRHFSWGPYRAQREAAAWIASLPAHRDEGSALEFAITDAHDIPLGVIAVLEVSRRDRRCVIGIWLGRAHWGSGVGDESEALLAHLVFGPLRMERLSAWVDVNNARSQRAFERLGFVNEGVLRAFQRHADERRDLIAYSLLREEWQASKMAAVPARVLGAAPPLFVCAPRPAG